MEMFPLFHRGICQQPFVMDKTVQYCDHAEKTLTHVTQKVLTDAKRTGQSLSCVHKGKVKRN